MTLLQRLHGCVVKSFRPAAKTGFWLIKITVPVSFGVLLLKFTGLLAVIAKVCAPLFALFGMPGEAALVFVTAALVNIYACIGVMETLGLSGHTVTILALMCLISHSLPVETAVQKRTGSSFWLILAIRLVTSFAGALILSLFLKADPQAVASTGVAMVSGGFGEEFMGWLIGMAILCAKILVLITLLMIMQRVMEEFGMIQWLSRMLKYPLMALGIPREAAFLWIVANTLGLAYGAGIIIDHVERGRLSARHADILNAHIAVSHSLLEDTLLFVAVGASLFWITVPRVLLAGAVVWTKLLVEGLMARRNGRSTA